MLIFVVAGFTLFAVCCLLLLVWLWLTLLLCLVVCCTVLNLLLLDGSLLFGSLGLLVLWLLFRCFNFDALCLYDSIVSYKLVCFVWNTIKLCNWLFAIGCCCLL